MDTQNTVPANKPSCLSLAWQDLKSNDKWYVKIILLALIECVPILNFCAIGYSLCWARDRYKSTDSKMPDSLITGETFKYGFFALVIAFVWAIVIMLLCIIPILGWIAALVITVFAPILFICMLRMMAFGKLGAAFAIGDVFKMFKRDIGGAMLAFWVPMLISMAIAFALGLISTLVLGSGANVNVTYMNNAVVAVSKTPSGLTMIMSLITTVITALVAVVTSLVCDRGLGHWVVRNVPEWFIPAGAQPAPQYAQPVAAQPVAAQPVVVSVQPVQPVQPVQSVQPVVEETPMVETASVAGEASVVETAVVENAAVEQEPVVEDAPITPAEIEKEFEAFTDKDAPTFDAAAEQQAAEVLTAEVDNPEYAAEIAEAAKLDEAGQAALAEAEAEGDSQE